MASPRAESYSTASGATVAGGRSAGGLPSWYTSQTARTWKVVPTANTLMSIDPAARADLNPNYPGAAPWRGAGGAPATLNAWGCLLPSSDANDGRVWAPLNGGHGDYGGNEGYVIDLLAEAPAWSMVGRPSGNSIDGLLTYGEAPGGDFSTGTYVDGRIRAKHGYTDFVHIPGTDLISCMRLTTGFGGGNATAFRCWLIDGVTGQHSLLDDYAAVTGSGGSHGGGSCWDSTRNVIWHIGINASNRILKTDPATGITTSHGTTDSRAGAVCQLVYIPTLDRIILMIGRSSLSFDVFDPNTNTWSGVAAASITGSQAPGFNGSYRDAGPVWVPGLNAIAMWNNTTQTTGITLLRPPEGPDGWRWDSLDAGPSNTVMPSDRNSTGTFGKFGYLAALNGFYLQNTYAGSLYFFALD